MSNVIVFGPTGRVASVVALTAHEKGAKVALAMRDTKKAIPGLDTESEKSGGFERVNADLTKPDSVAAAVKATGAKRAFMYHAHGTADHMKSTLEAMKSSGIEFVVFLSSYTVYGRLDEFTPTELIAFVHARVEMSLDEVFGAEKYVALRPGGFASNHFRYKGDIMAGEARVFMPEDVQMDWIASTDIGRVGGAILAQGPRNGQQKVYIYGPEVVPQGKALQRVGKALGKDVKITSIDEEEALQVYLRNGVPMPAAEYMVRKSKGGKTSFHQPDYETGVENVKLYTGRPALTLEEWTEDNKQLFLE